MSRIVLFWDLDGTLLTTNRAGIMAWERAIQELTGHAVDFAGLATAGLTEVEIASHVLALQHMPSEPSHIDRLLRTYERYLPAMLPLRSGGPLPGVKPLLDELKGRPEVFSMLLTGNTRAGAAAKLAQFGMAGYFSFGAFADDAPDRPGIARAALAIATQQLGDSISMDRAFVIGDTPHDIHCGQHIGARTIAVASGPYEAQVLRRYAPWTTLERLPDPGTFCALIGLTAAVNASIL